MAQLLQRILVQRDEQFMFVVIGAKYLARTDMGITRGDFENVLRAFDKPYERVRVMPGWKVGLSDNWRRRENVIRKGEAEFVRFLHFLSPSGKLIVLDFFYQPLPMQVVNELKAFLDSFSSPQSTAEDTEGESHAEGQLHGQPVSEAFGDPAAEGAGGEHQQVLQGGQGVERAGHGLAEGPGREDEQRRPSFGVAEGN